MVSCTVQSTDTLLRMQESNFCSSSETFTWLSDQQCFIRQTPKLGIISAAENILNFQLMLPCLKRLRTPQAARIPGPHPHPNRTMNSFRTFKSKLQRNPEPDYIGRSTQLNAGLVISSNASKPNLLTASLYWPYRQRNNVDWALTECFKQQLNSAIYLRWADKLKPSQLVLQQAFLEVTAESQLHGFAGFVLKLTSNTNQTSLLALAVKRRNQPTLT